MNRHDLLVSDYIENVLPAFIPGISKDIMTGGESGKDSFSIHLGDNFTKGTQYEPNSKRFVHFTSLSVLQSIVNENAIRLYSLLNVNDPNEYNYFSDDSLSDITTQKIKANTYILSLCSADVLNSKNLLNLWRLYGKDGYGVAIEFEIEFFGHSSDGSYSLGKIIYEKPNLKDFKIKNLEFEQRHNVKIDIPALERVPRCFHKAPYYEIEEEVRLMFFEAGSTIRAKLSPKQDQFKWDYNSRNKLITYHKLELGQKIGSHCCIIIKKIHPGFRHSKEAVKEMKEHFSTIHLGRQLQGLTDIADQPPIVEPSTLGQVFE